MSNTILSILAFLLCHATLGWYLHNERPVLPIMPPRPSEESAVAMSFGDSQFLYRAFALQVQNAGDTGGRFTPMSAYDMADVLAWMKVLQSLDPRSNFYPFLLIRYYSLARTADDLTDLIGFIDHDVELAPDRKWYWQTQVVTMARHELNDAEWALRLSRKLANFEPYLPSGNAWVLQMEPALLADMGRFDEAQRTMERVVEAYGVRMTEPEKNWTADFFAKLASARR